MWTCLYAPSAPLPPRLHTVSHTTSYIHSAAFPEAQHWCSAARAVRPHAHGGDRHTSETLTCPEPQPGSGPVNCRSTGAVRLRRTWDASDATRARVLQTQHNIHPCAPPAIFQTVQRPSACSALLKSVDRQASARLLTRHGTSPPPQRKPQRKPLAALNT